MVESKHEKGVIYTASDDGLLHLTKDNGTNWKNVTPKGLPETLINSIEISPHDPATVYLATTRYKFNDYTPGLYKAQIMENRELINTGISGYTKVVREDEKRKDLLFARNRYWHAYLGMEALNWSALQLNLPITPITDIAISHDNVVVATQEDLWIFRRFNILQQYNQSSSEGKLYTPTPTYIANWSSDFNSNESKGTGFLKA